MKYLILVVFIVMFGIAGNMDYSDEVATTCGTDMECLEMYGY